jgi:hypothetical protein
VIRGPIAGENRSSWFYLGSTANSLKDRFYTRFGRTSDGKPLFSQCVDTIACDVSECDLCVVRGCAWCHISTGEGLCMRQQNVGSMCTAAGTVVISDKVSGPTCAKPVVFQPSVGTQPTSFFISPEDDDMTVSPGLTIGLAVVGVLCVVFVVVLIVCIVRAARDPSRDSIKVDNAVFDANASKKTTKSDDPKTVWAQDVRPRPHDARSRPSPSPPPARSGIYSNRSSESGDEPETIPDQPTAPELRREIPYGLEPAAEAYEQVPGQSKVPILVSGRETVAVAAAAADAGYNQVPMRKVIADATPAKKKAAGKQLDALDYNDIPVSPIGVNADGEPVYDELKLRQTFIAPDDGAVDIEAALE